MLGEMTQKQLAQCIIQAENSDEVITGNQAY